MNNDYPINKFYNAWVRKDKINSLAYAISSLVILQMASDSLMTEEDALKCLKKATDRVVSIIADVDRKDKS